MGKPQREESPDVVKSKVLSYILRHGAEKEMLHVRSDGYIKVADLVGREQCSAAERQLIGIVGKAKMQGHRST